ncbi:MAG TPA: DUF2207 domain-containing protein [Rhodanobacteraceae bacterium]|nr:DUF2207 domain-containing protein [Rhodanobacteraceae bacterium]
MRAFGLAFLSLITALLLAAGTARADERILDYHADITIQADGTLEVAEHIRLNVEGVRIRHGIYRDFPTDYRDRHHNRYRVGFDFIGATLDGADVDWQSERRANGIRIKLGNAASMVPHGQHEYVLRYQVSREIGFFTDHDELYWNVNGTGWEFAANRVSATLQLPTNVPADQLKAYGYTGSMDSREQAVRVSQRDDGASYATTRALGAQENLSVVLEFPKGIVRAPSAAQRLVWLLRDNRNLLWGLAGLIVLWAYYLRAWNRYGRDPASGPLVAAYDPPDGDSAAALRFVRQMGYDNTCFTAGILGLAAKGGLDVSRAADASWSIFRKDLPADATLTSPEQALYQTLFAGGKTLHFEQANHLRISAASKAFEAALKQAFEKKYFNTNLRLLWPGLAITVVTAWLASLGGGPGAAFLLLWLSVWSVAVAFLITSAVQARGEKGAVGLWIMATIFSIGEIGALIALGTLVGFAVLPVFLALLGTNIAFMYWLRAPTRIGAKLLDRIEGFRWYLGVTEKQELDSRYAPESQPELFAAYLPYALALGVGNAWAERFASALTPMQMQAASPTWYHGSNTDNFNSADFARFSSDFSSSFNGAIASSSSAPGSSSGSSGGSGGGGGGGGGGGW